MMRRVKIGRKGHKLDHFTPPSLLSIYLRMCRWFWKSSLSFFPRNAFCSYSFLSSALSSGFSPWNYILSFPQLALY